ncbi:MAG: ROK family protein [Candidatus Omnitrophota bacterium]
MVKKYIIGVDFGATFIKLGLVGLNGNIAKKSIFPASDFKSKDTLISKIVREVNSLIVKKKDILGIGIGVPGPVDHEKGIIYNLTNLKGWRDVPLRSILVKRLKLPVFMDNDANAAALGELEWGAAKGFSDMVYITLGSGLGGGVVIDGKVYRGRGYSAAELGHICIERKGLRCNCGSIGCLETFTGAGYINKEATRRLRRGEKSILLKLAGGRYSAITPRLISEAAKRKDRFSIRFWQELGINLGIGLAGIVNIFNPEIIVIGGGVSKAGNLIFDSMNSAIRRRAMPIFTKGLKIKRAKFISDAGTVGAAALVKNSL